MLTEYQKDILVGALVVTGILSIISGTFIITVMLLAGIAFFSIIRRFRPVES